MNCKSTSKNLSDYLAGTLDQAQMAAIEEHFNECSDCQREFQTVEMVWQKLGRLPEVEPSTSMRVKFESMLAAYEAGQAAESRGKWFDRFRWPRDQTWSPRPVLQFGVAAAMLLIGLFLGSRFQSSPTRDGLRGNQELTVLRQEVQNLSKLVALSLLQQPSSSERLRGVQYSVEYSSMDEPDAETLKALLQTLNYDQTLNVRLAAVDALAMFYDQDMVRKGLIESLSRQTSPLIQIALINLFVEFREKEAIQTLKFLQGNEMFNKTVRRRAAWAIEQLQKER